MGLRIAYGYRRSPEDFAHLAPDDLFLDGPGTQRLERRTMIGEKLRPGAGDVLVLLALDDLGDATDLALVRADIESLGVTIEVAAPPAATAARPGRPSACDLTSEQRERFAALWRDPAMDGGYIVRKACQEAGVDPGDARARHMMRQRLRRLFGPRRRLSQADR